jgi:hypothetical protein
MTTITKNMTPEEIQSAVKNELIESGEDLSQYSEALAMLSELAKIEPIRDFQINDKS